MRYGVIFQRKGVVSDMYYCQDCEHCFDEPLQEYSGYEYDDMTGDWLVFEVCPYCKSENWKVLV